VNYWTTFSKKLCQKIEQPLSVGYFTPEIAAEKHLRLVIGRQRQENQAVTLYWLVDEQDGVIADAKFQAIGRSMLIGAAEAASELVMRKNYDQARRITAELIDKQLRDKSNSPAFPPEGASCLNQILLAIDEAAEQCMDIPVADIYTAPPLSLDLEAGEGYPGWKQLPQAQKLAVISDIIAKEIQPYVELDAGGVQVVNLIDDRELIIAYQGACTSCHSATGATLSAIQQILRAKVDPDIIVTPELGNLH
jgi:NifU-like protein